MKHALLLIVFAAINLFGCGTPDTDGAGTSSDARADADVAESPDADVLVAETTTDATDAAAEAAGPCELAAKCAKENELCGAHLVCKCGILAPFEYAERAVCPPSPDAGPEASADAADAAPETSAAESGTDAGDAGAVCAAFGPCPFPGWTCTTPKGLALTCAACRVWLTPGFMCPPAPPADAGVVDTGADTRADAAPETSAVDTGSPSDTGLATADTAPVDTGAVDTGSASDTGSSADTGVLADSGADTRTDTGYADTGADTGSSSDTGADTGSPADTGVVADSGADTGTDTGASDTGSSAEVDTGTDSASLLATLIFSWTPPTGYTQVGPVRVVGGYPGGPAWDTLCTMSVSGGAYSCLLSLPKGASVTFVVEHADDKLPTKRGWVFDRGCYPGGGCGKDFGTFTLKFSTGADHPYALEWNGYPPAPPAAITFNGKLTVS